MKELLQKYIGSNVTIHLNLQTVHGVPLQVNGTFFGFDDSGIIINSDKKVFYVLFDSILFIVT